MTSFRKVRESPDTDHALLLTCLRQRNFSMIFTERAAIPRKLYLCRCLLLLRTGRFCHKTAINGKRYSVWSEVIVSTSSLSIYNILRSNFRYHSAGGYCQFYQGFVCANAVLFLYIHVSKSYKFKFWKGNKA